MLLEKDFWQVFQHRKLTVELATARCQECGTRTRVLPADVLPYKTYSLPAIVSLAMEYARGQKSLREAAWQTLGERTPAYSTLHGWTDGLGAYVLGRKMTCLGGLGFEQACACLIARDGCVRELLRHEPLVDKRRYRSEPRRERLAALLILSSITERVSPQPSPQPLAALRCLILLFLKLSSFQFPSRILCTAIEHGDVPSGADLGSLLRKGAKVCPTRTRSPPGDTNASQH